MIALYRKHKRSKAQRPISCQHRPVVEKTAQTPSPVTGSAGKTSTKCDDCARQKSAVRRYRWRLIIGLLPAYFLASLDLTIVATALPFIASHFDKFNQLNWIVTSFSLTSTAFIPAFGQLADIFGRHLTLHFALLWMTIGSILCATAVTWPMLLLGRALQGLSAAGITNIVMIVLADNVSLEEQAKNISIFQLMNGIGYSVGPIIGGYLTNTNWRYCFVISAALPLLTHVSVFWLLRKDLKPGTVSLSRKSTTGQSTTQQLLTGLQTIDFGGMILFILGIGLIIIATTWGGATYSWSSAAVLVTLILGIVFLFAFALYEYLLEPGRILSKTFPHTIPMIPHTLFRRRDVGLLAFILAATGTAMYSVYYFIGIYFTLVEGYPASKAGVQLLYYIPGIGAGVYAAIFTCNVWPKQTFYPIASGTLIETVGIAVLTYAVKSRKSNLVNGMMAVAGAGTGIRLMPTNLHLVGVWPDRVAAVNSVARFVLPFGGTLALTIMGSVFNNKMAGVFGDREVRDAIANATATSANANSTNSGGSFSVKNQGVLSAINNLPLPARSRVRNAGADATMWAFISILPILGLAVVCAGFLGNVWIGAGKGHESEEAGREKAAGHGAGNTDGGVEHDAERRAEAGDEQYELKEVKGVFAKAHGIRNHPPLPISQEKDVRDTEGGTVAPATSKSTSKSTTMTYRPNPARSEVLYGVYLLALIRGTVKAEKSMNR